MTLPGFEFYFGLFIGICVFGMGFCAGAFYESLRETKILEEFKKILKVKK